MGYEDSGTRSRDSAIKPGTLIWGGITRIGRNENVVEPVHRFLRNRSPGGIPDDAHDPLDPEDALIVEIAPLFPFKEPVYVGAGE